MVLVPTVIAAVRYIYFATKGIGVSSVSNDTYMAPLSAEWIVLQVMAFAAAIAAGYVAARWSKQGAWAAPCLLALLLLVLSALDPPEFESKIVLTIWIAYSSIGYLLGAVLYMKKYENRESESS